MKTLVIVILSLLINLTASAQKIRFKRVCSQSITNILSWQIDADTCVLLTTIKVFGTDNVIFPFAVIDSGVAASAKQYIHNNTNNKPWMYFLQYKVICGIDTLTRYTDTLSIDVTNPDPSHLDSVSVDPITNKVYLGWISNKTPDFYVYNLYNTDRANPVLEIDYRDTFYTDQPPTDPKAKSLTYYITSVDSCNNRNAFGNPHKTINLSASIDTCKNDVNISFTAYVGWSSIRILYLFRKINGGIYLPIDSFSSSQLSYTDKGLPPFSTISYFIRAIKLDSLQRNITSSSNSSTVISSNSVNPAQTKINYVSNNNSDQIELEILPNPLSNYSSIDLIRYPAFGSPVKIYSFSPGETIFQDISSANTSVQNYYLIGKNVCGLPTDTSIQSNNIVVHLAESNNIISLNWNRYFTWNTGVKEYIIYRATGAKPDEATNFTVLKTSNLDTFNTDLSILDKTSCYFILAYENGGINISKSNTVCNNKTGSIFYPNAIITNGLNRVFTFSGIGIDLNKSSIEIYNRWGNLVFSKNDISSGWAGESNLGGEVDAGVYFFSALIFQGTDSVKLNGNITVIK